MFISIRWKATLLLSAILLVIMLTWIGRSVYFELKAYKTDLIENQTRHQNILDQLLNDNFLRLSQYSQLISEYDFVQTANLADDIQLKQNQLNATWFALNLNIAVDYIAISNSQKQEIIKAHQFNDAEALDGFKTAFKLLSAAESLPSSELRNMVFCNENCIQIVVEPFFFANGEQGYITIGQNMSDLVSRFNKLSESQLAILMSQPIEEGEYIGPNEWKSKLWAAIDFEKTLQQLGYLKENLNELKPIDKVENIWQIWRKDYFINQLIPKNYMQIGYPATFVNIYNNKPQKELFKDYFLNQIVTGTMAWFFAAILMMLVLLSAIQRISRVANAMAFLPIQQYDMAKREILPKKSSTRDELTDLEYGALELVDKLENLGSKVESSQQQLRKQILTITRSKDFLQRLFDNANLFIVTQNQDFKIEQSNAFYSHFFAQQKLQIFTDLLQDESDQDEMRRQASALFDNTLDSFQTEVLMHAENNKNLMVAWTHTLVINETGQKQILSIGIDVTQRKKDESALHWLANNDSLTKIGNRRVFHSMLNRMLVTESQGAVVFIDVNRFKQINDIFGHMAGDQVLIKIAEKLKNSVREGDVVCRLAGDEFTLLLAGVNRTSLESILKQLATQLNDSIKLDDGRRVDYSASLGAALFPEHGKDEQTLIMHSDMAMYQAKRKGLNHWHIFDYSDDSLQELKAEHELMGIIKKALNEELFALSFQPIYNLKTQRICHYEVLLRLTCDDGRNIPPSVFIPVAERVGLIASLDTWVMVHVFEYIKQLHTESRLNCEKMKFSINLSAPSLQDQYFAQKMVKLVERYNVDPEYLIIELTETAYIDNLNQVLKNLSFLKEKGFAIALDDFGVGFSSFSYMEKLPLSYVKLDGSYVADLANNEKNKAFIESVVIMAKAFEMFTIAEYVEDKATLEVLSDIGVDYAQGYLIGESMPSILDDNEAEKVITNLVVTKSVTLN